MSMFDVTDLNESRILINYSIKWDLVWLLSQDSDAYISYDGNITSYKNDTVISNYFGSKMQWPKTGSVNGSVFSYNNLLDNKCG